ncbi:MAG: aldose epimerase family protein [Trueperaceae bacterium]|nr:aldose epimerase family protein [Trueperaceae bacterium]
MADVQVQASPFGTTATGVAVTRFDLSAPDGSGVSVLDFGAVVLEVRVPDRDGRLANVVLGHAELGGYERNAPYFGAVVGRCANRIAGARFTLDGEEHRLAANEGRHQLHGGPGGFHLRAWHGQAASSGDGRAEVILRRVSPDGEEAYPGTAEVEARIGWSVRHELSIELHARADAPTLMNLAHHGYWNLAGEGSGSVDDHLLAVAADAYLPVGTTLIPTGELAAVAGTPFDLRSGRRIGDVVRAGHRQVRIANGIDHNLVLSREVGEAARLTDPRSGRRLRLLTDQPGLQVYTGNALDGRIVGRSGRAYRQGDGVALEAQGFPDAPHHPHFPSVVLRPGDAYRSSTVFAFDADG